MKYFNRITEILSEGSMGLDRLYRTKHATKVSYPSKLARIKYKESQANSRFDASKEKGTLPGNVGGDESIPDKGRDRSRVHKKRAKRAYEKKFKWFNKAT